MLMKLIKTSKHDEKMKRVREFIKETLQNIP